MVTFSESEEEEVERRITRAVLSMNSMLDGMRRQSLASSYTAVFCLGSLNQTALVLQIGFAKAYSKPIVLVVTEGIEIHRFILAMVDYVVVDDGNKDSRTCQLLSIDRQIQDAKKREEHHG